MKPFQKVGITSVLLASFGFAGAQSWTRVTPTSTPAAQLGAMLLLTDGTVMVHDDLGDPSHWYKLTPNAFGSYVNGTWTSTASMPAGYGPLYFSSSVIPDGRLLIEGGEYNFGSPVWTTQGAIYDPTADTWVLVAPPAGWHSIGDAQQIILADGRVLQASCCDGPVYHLAYFAPKTLTWTPADISNSKADVYDEEGFTLLPNGKVLTVDAYVDKGSAGTNAELYNPTTNSWSLAASTPTQLWDSGHEFGPAVLRPDGTVFQAGAVPATAIYNTKTSTWTEGPNFPDNLDIADGPAALETNGKVLMMASPGQFKPPATFLEWDGTNLTPIVGPPRASVDSSYYGHMLELPTGQILFTDFSDDVEVFTPARAEEGEGRRESPNRKWAPEVLFSPFFLEKGNTYQVHGSRLAGMSQGAAYGDDYQSATNYALVRLTNLKSGHVFYARTHDPSSYDVQSSDVQKTHFDVPAAMETGIARMEVVTNGLASQFRFVLVF
jgi:hypothetical protein